MNIFVVDHDGAFRECVSGMLRSFKLSSNGYGSAEEFIASCDHASEGMVIAALRMPGMSGVELHEWIKRNDLFLPMILVTAHASTRVIVQAIKIGVINVVDKPLQEDEFWYAVQEAMSIFRKHIERHRARIDVLSRLRSLTLEETGVLEGILCGLTNKAIAQQLHTSGVTVERRRLKIFEKMQADSLARLTLDVALARDPAVESRSLR